MDSSGSTLELLPNTGHYVQFEKPAEIIDINTAGCGGTPCSF